MIRQGENLKRKFSYNVKNDNAVNQFNTEASLFTKKTSVQTSKPVPKSKTKSKSKPKKKR